MSEKSLSEHIPECFKIHLSILSIIYVVLGMFTVLIVRECLLLLPFELAQEYAENCYVFASKAAEGMVYFVVYVVIIPIGKYTWHLLNSLACFFVTLTNIVEEKQENEKQ